MNKNKLYKLRTSDIVNGGLRIHDSDYGKENRYCNPELMKIKLSYVKYMPDVDLTELNKVARQYPWFGDIITAELKPLLFLNLKKNYWGNYLRGNLTHYYENYVDVKDIALIKKLGEKYFFLPNKDDLLAALITLGIEHDETMRDMTNRYEQMIRQLHKYLEFLETKLNNREWINARFENSVEEVRMIL